MYIFQNVIPSDICMGFIGGKLASAQALSILANSIFCNYQMLKPLFHETSTTVIYLTLSGLWLRLSDLMHTLQLRLTGMDHYKKSNKTSK
ncbi:Hypothetical predicted protein [Octopus vulgaris]|uniref:Uncharacterized protein n=1 Tax=Octopus vulgaris TaxID=6645 RepID=A0AA36BB38_OCTVU|nr:Hypothetical predicted protein [Octopus vulgaris]